MLDPDSRHGRELKAAEEFFALARTTPVPFMRSYYQRVAERYLSSVGELRAVGPSAGISAFPKRHVAAARAAATARSGRRRTGLAIRRGHSPGRAGKRHVATA
jgi:hypothetical protein